LIYIILFYSADKQIRLVFEYAENRKMLKHNMHCLLMLLTIAQCKSFAGK